ncbi:tripartite tricarboxylate transporter substrate binding protein [Rhodoferax ferrireducens]|uniref:tripartite tricarboxylate transporter substrate binding protein n=1 Tax=Rhodoferax ferrireducens TaxID=192843 RepID=UPI000E0D236A|nr:tripartite tricarboxylate transporter substrate binding protein [Rhodoferax ferrireducens]
MNASSHVFSRRAALRLVMAASAWAVAPGLRAQPGEGGFPRSPITLWVPWPAGGATDLMMRLLAELAGEHLGQQVIVKNRPGAGGTLVMPVLLQAAPDGYAIAQLPHPVFRMPHVQKVLWDPIRDTSPIIQISGVTFGMVVPVGSPFRSFGEVLAFAAARPGELTISTNGTGTTPHVVLEELLTRHGLNYIHVPYKGTAEQMVAVVAGQVMVGVNSNGFAPFVDSGQLRLLVTLGPARTKRWPQVPTLKELGHGIVAMSPYGLVGPRGMDAVIVRTLHEAFKVAMFDSAHMAELAKYDQELAYLNSADYARAMRETFETERHAARLLPESSALMVR